MFCLPIPGGWHFVSFPFYLYIIVSFESFFVAKQLNCSHFGSVILATVSYKFHPCKACLMVGKARSNNIFALDYGFLCSHGFREENVVLVCAALRLMDDSLDEGSYFERFGPSGLDGLMHDQLGRHSSKHGPSVLWRAAKLTILLLVSHLLDSMEYIYRGLVVTNLLL